ncbi:E3 SUMO-protein ligase ZBED1-like [Anticarsia gemmatalis]|uniref:E3 SUMO-protein ligase ZBED1-like n=1 Tax=Anticarsia gemmatalis TaxID=129554 RepID=UPI003F777B6D
MKKAVNEHLNKRNQFCVAHTLNLAIGDCMKDDGGADDNPESVNAPKLQELLSKCRTIVSHFKHSDKSSYKLREMQKQMELPELKVIQDIATRWNSQYYMLSRLLELKVPLSATLVAISNPPDNLTNEEWIAVEDVAKILKPAEQATGIVSGEKYPTLSSTIPLIKSLKDAIRRKTPVSEAGKKLQRVLLSVLEKRLGVLDLNKTACKSTLLDPRFKKEGFCSNVVAERAYQWCLTELTSSISESRRSVTEDVLAAEILPGTSNATESRDLDDDLWSSFDERMRNVTDSAPITNAAISLKQYVESDYLDRKGNPLTYWENRKNTYPELYKMAIKYLCIPATSVPAERVFSKAGILCNQRRNRLDPKKVDQILFLDSFTNNT